MAPQCQSYLIVAPPPEAGEQSKKPQKIHKDTFPFLELPPELRNKIYALGLPYNVELSSFKPGDVNILGTCKQIHDEASSILYGSNGFGLYVEWAGNMIHSMGDPCTTFTLRGSYPFDWIGSTNLGRIRKLVVDMQYNPSYTRGEGTRNFRTHYRTTLQKQVDQFITSLSHMGNLKQLTIRLNHRS